MSSSFEMHDRRDKARSDHMDIDDMIDKSENLTFAPKQNM